MDRLPPFCLIMLVVSGTVPTATAAPETFNTALPVAAGEFLFREQFLYRRATADPSPADRVLDVRGGISVLGYGVTGQLAVFAALPYFDKQLEVRSQAGRVTRGNAGFADLRLFGRYTVYRVDTPGRTFRIAPFFGIELPIAEDQASDRLGRLPAPLQLGSGSWDPFGGIVLSYQTLDFQFDAQLSYQLEWAVKPFEMGDQTRLDASLQYRVWPGELAAGLPGFLYAVVEGNLLHAGRNRINGLKDPNSGGISFFLAPGLQYVTKRWIIEGIVQLPVSQDLNGRALADDFTVRAGFRVNF